MHLGESKIVYFFQALLMGVAAYASYKQPFGAWVSALIFIGLWWAGLSIFASQPAAGYFYAERAFLSKLRQIHSSKTKRVCALAFFYFLFWPIFIAKGFYLALLILCGGVFHFFKSQS
jgi:hypothetical protein